MVFKQQCLETVTATRALSNFTIRSSKSSTEQQKESTGSDPECFSLRATEVNVLGFLKHHFWPCSPSLLSLRLGFAFSGMLNAS